MQLKDCSKDVLGGILDVLNGRYWIALILCGSKILNSKLIGSTQVRNLAFTVLRRNKDPTPFCMRNFPNLTYISIEVKSSTSEVATTVQYWKTLPLKLKILKVKCWGGLPSFQRAMADTSNLFPELQVLDITDYHHGLHVREAWHWPQSLLDLRVRYTDQWYELNLDTLPPNLTNLDITVNLIHYTAESRFPPNLTNLYLEVLGFDNPYLDFISWLPTQLKRFKLQVFDGESYQGIKPDIRFPNSLTWLSIPMLRYECLIDILPPNLVYLEFNDDEDDISRTWPKNQLQRLPPSLTVARGLFEPIIGESYAKLLMPHLTELDRPVSLRALPFVPRNLKYLEIACDDVTPDSEDSDSEWEEMPTQGPLPESLAVNKFPPALEKLIFAIELEAERWLPFVPHETLTSLTCEELTLAQLRLVPPNLKCLELTKSNILMQPTSLAALPRTLTCLKVCGGTWSARSPHILSSAQDLPSKLLKLSIQDAHISIDILASLPDTLTKLHLTHVCRSAPSDKVPDSPDSKLTIPTRLQSLKLCIITDLNDFPLGPLIVALPPEIEVVDIKYARYSLYNSQPIQSSLDNCLGEEHLQHLPSSLRKLILPRSDKIEATCLEYLPPGLEILKIGNITPTWFK